MKINCPWLLENMVKTSELASKLVGWELDIYSAKTDGKRNINLPKKNRRLLQKLIQPLPMKILRKRRRSRSLSFNKKKVFMRIADLAKELKIKETVIIDKLKSLKLKAKDDGLLTAGVEMIVRDALADDGIGKRVVDDRAKKKASKSKTVKDDVKAVAKKKASVQKDEVSDEKSTKVKKSDSSKDKKSKKVVKKFVSALEKEEGVPTPPKPSKETIISKPAPTEEVKAVVAPVEPVKVVPLVVAAPVAVASCEDSRFGIVSEPEEVVAKIEIPKAVPTVDPGFRKTSSVDPVKPLLKKRKRSDEDGIWPFGC